MSRIRRLAATHACALTGPTATCRRTGQQPAAYPAAGTPVDADQPCHDRAEPRRRFQPHRPEAVAVHAGAQPTRHGSRVGLAVRALAPGREAPASSRPDTVQASSARGVASAQASVEPDRAPAVEALAVEADARCCAGDGGERQGGGVRPDLQRVRHRLALRRGRPPAPRPGWPGRPAAKATRHWLPPSRQRAAAVIGVGQDNARPRAGPRRCPAELNGNRVPTSPAGPASQLAR